ncbi:MAG: hypothetical protein ACOYJC_01495 [Christensenellales bacterium]|jgi:hypothetical protein
MVQEVFSSGLAKLMVETSAYFHYDKVSTAKFPKKRGFDAA